MLWTSVDKFLCTPCFHFSWVFTEEWNLNQTRTLCLTAWRTAGPLDHFLHILTTLATASLSYSNHPNRWGVLSHRGSHLHCPNTSDGEDLFIYLLATCISSLGKCQFLCSVLIGLSFYCWVTKVLYVSGYSLLSDIWVARISCTHWVIS